jgi:BirA family transcriptional regulator, biotin operon repressor / biotin---[acetyl-CoA-carboxylase] ligase
MTASKRISEQEKNILAKIKEYNTGRFREWSVLCFESLSSTMDIARNIKGYSDANKVLITTKSQISGRGRLGRIWSESEGGLCLTLHFKLNNLQSSFSRCSLSGLSLVVGCALVEAFSGLGCRLKVKWPNDILSLTGKKLAGVLVESSTQGTINSVNIGIGVNVLNTPSELQNVTCLKMLGCEALDLDFLAVRIALLVDTYLERFLRESFTGFKEQWLKDAAYIGTNITVSSSNESLTGIMMGVSDDGALLVQVGNAIKEITVGDVE